MVIHGEPPPWTKKVKFVGPRLDFEGSLYEDYGFVEVPVNFNLDDQVVKRSEDLLQDMYEKTVSLLRQHHAALLKTVKVCYVLVAMPVPILLSHFAFVILGSKLFSSVVLIQQLLSVWIRLQQGWEIPLKQNSLLYEKNLEKNKISD